MFTIDLNKACSFKDIAFWKKINLNTIYFLPICKVWQTKYIWEISSKRNLTTGLEVYKASQSNYKCSSKILITWVIFILRVAGLMRTDIVRNRSWDVIYWSSIEHTISSALNTFQQKQGLLHHSIRLWNFCLADNGRVSFDFCR